MMDLVRQEKNNMEIEKRIYPAYAFTENEREKSTMNSTIYNELKENTEFQDIKLIILMIMTLS